MGNVKPMQKGAKAAMKETQMTQQQRELDVTVTDGGTRLVMPEGLYKRPVGMTDDEYRELRLKDMRKRHAAMSIFEYMAGREGITDAVTFIDWYRDTKEALEQAKPVVPVSSTKRQVRRVTRPKRRIVSGRK